MSTLFKFPKYIKTEYRLNIDTGKYEKQPSMLPFQKLPSTLKIEPTQEVKIIQQGADKIITGAYVNKKREFFTGLIKTDVLNSFQGNNYEIVKGQKVLSLVMFAFSSDFRNLNVFYFSRYYIHNPKERNAFVVLFLSAQTKVNETQKEVN